jgi:threonine dehydratase/serine racemase
MGTDATEYSAPTLQAVQDAAARIAPHIHRTPLLTCATLDRAAGRKVFLKCENLQKVGAFKFRGACNAVFTLPEADASRGVVTHSSGNHGQALALAARVRGITAHVVLPDNAASVKARALEEYGAIVHRCAPTRQAREDAARQVRDSTGATLVPPFDHPEVIAGQGTLVPEVLQQLAAAGETPPDAIIAPVGGGGLISGISIAAAGLAPGVRVIGCEPSGADDAARSLSCGRRISHANPHSIADGLLTGLGDLTWPIIQRLVERIVTVTDADTVAAMRLIWERAKLVVEPSAAVAVAGVLSPQFRSLGGLNRIVVILSGGNVDLGRLPW